MEIGVITHVDALPNKVEEIVTSLRKNGCHINIKDTPEKGCYLIANPDIKKAILIGNAFGCIKSYKIDVKKWWWAEEEGFTRDEMVEKMGREIFVEIHPNDIVEYMLDK